MTGPSQLVNLTIPGVTGVETFLLDKLAEEVPGVHIRIGGRGTVPDPYGREGACAIIVGEACYARFVEHLFYKLRVDVTSPVE